LAVHNKLLGEFNLDGIAPAPRGMPQIDVTFDIDANGILKVSAKDKGTNKETNITIKASSGLSDDEIKRMIREAEENAEADKKQVELINARNQADGQIAFVKKDFDAMKDKLPEEEVKKIEDAIAAVEEAKCGEDVEAISKAIADMMNSTNEMYRIKTEADQAAAAEKPAEATAKENVVDAEFTEKPADKK